MTTDERLRVMLAEKAIKDVQLRYCRGIDRFDWGLIEGCFHPDAIHDIGPFKGTVAEFIPWASSASTRAPPDAWRTVKWASM